MIHILFHNKHGNKTKILSRRRYPYLISFLPDALPIVVLTLLHKYIDLYLFGVILAIYIAVRITIHLKAVKYFRSGTYYLSRRDVNKYRIKHKTATKYLAEMPGFIDVKPRYTRTLIGTRLNKSPHTVHVSRGVLNSARNDPVKYLVKYFELDITREYLESLAQLNQTLKKSTHAISTIKKAEKFIARNFHHPWYIHLFYSYKLLKDLGLSFPFVKIEYGQYVFQYTSPKGRSQESFHVYLDNRMIGELTEYINERVLYQETASYQRSLMTPRLREFILERDNYTCQNCEESQFDDPNLPLEIDHIYPISRGGLTEKDNLQVLCRTCNRSKSDKVDW